MSAILPMTMEGVVVRKSGRTILGPIDHVLDGRGVTALLGPNGSGKSTWLRVMHGLQHPRAGTLRWAVPREEARAAQGFVFQTPILLRRSVVDNLAYPLRLRGHSRAAARAAAAPWLDRIDLTRAAGAPADALSGGERQLLAIARALITQPQLLFLDEPTAALDGRSTRLVETLIGEAVAEDVRVMLATHDVGQARRLADDVAFLHGGRLLESGPAGAFFAAPRSDQARAFLRGDIVE